MKKLSKNLIYIIINLIYIIPGLFCSLFYICFSMNYLPKAINVILFTIVLEPFLLFYYMSWTFTILIHPIIQIIIFLLVRKNKDFSKKYIIIVFILSLIITFIFLYLMWGKGYIYNINNNNNVRPNFA